MLLYNFQTIVHNYIPVDAQISDGEINPILGQNYTLICTSVVSFTSYQWKRNDEVLTETGPTLSFLSLKLTDAGGYTCGNERISSMRIYIHLQS